MSNSIESFREILDSLLFSFSAVCLLETWCQPHETSNSNLLIPAYLSLTRLGKIVEEEGLNFLTWIPFLQSQRWLSSKFQYNRMFVHRSFLKKSKSIVLNLTYRPPNGDPNELENHFKNILSKRKITNKELVLVETLIFMSWTLMKARWFKVLWI